MTKKQMLKAISCQKERNLFKSLCESKKSTSYLIRMFGHRFSKYIHDINTKFGYPVKKELRPDRKNYNYWI